MTNSFRLFLLISLTIVMDVLGKKKIKKKVEKEKSDSNPVTIDRTWFIVWIVATVGLSLFIVIILITCYCDRKRYREKIRHLETSISTIETTPMVIHTVAASEVVVMKNNENLATAIAPKPSKPESKMESVDEEESKKKEKKKKKKSKNKKKSRKTETVETTQEGEKSVTKTIPVATGREKTRTAKTATGGTTVEKQEPSDGESTGYPKPTFTTTTGASEGTCGTAELNLVSKRVF